MIFRTRNAARALVFPLALGFTVALVPVEPALAQGTDDMYEITSRMEMPGMALSVPAQVVKLCVAKNGKDDEFIPRKSECKIVDSKRTGNKFTYKMACGGSDPATMDGEVVFGTGAYEGKMRMTMTKSNQSMQMTYSGQRIGSCTATK
jgi:hypothetical protein